MHVSTSLVYAVLTSLCRVIHAVKVLYRKNAFVLLKFFVRLVY